MFTKEQILNAAKKAGIVVNPTPAGMEPSFVFSNGDRSPIMDDKIILDNNYLESELLGEQDTVNIDSLVIDDSFTLSLDDSSLSNKYKNNVSKNNYKDFSKKEPHKHGALFYYVNISL